MDGMTQHCCLAALHAKYPGDDAWQHQKVKTWGKMTQLSVRWKSTRSDNLCLCILQLQKSAWCVTQEAFCCKGSTSSLFRHPCFADKMMCLATAARSRALECESELGWAWLQVSFKRDLSQEGLAMFLKAIHCQPLWSLIWDLAVLSIMTFHEGCRMLLCVTHASSMHKSSRFTER